MVYKYLYIEDDQVSSNAFKTSLEINNLIKIDLKTPKKMKEQIEYIKNCINDIDGILLDLRLDDNVSGRDEKPDYSTAKTLAQEIRGQARDGVIKEIPIILIWRFWLYNG